MISELSLEAPCFSGERFFGHGGFGRSFFGYRLFRLFRFYNGLLRGFSEVFSGDPVPRFMPPGQMLQELTLRFESSRSIREKVLDHRELGLCSGIPLVHLKSLAICLAGHFCINIT